MRVEQLNMFDYIDECAKETSPNLKAINYFREHYKPPAPPEPTAAEIARAASDLCFLFTVSEHTRGGKVHFLVSRDEAMRFCSDDRTKGVYMGGKWMYCWTSVDNAFVSMNDKIVIGRNVTDNGKYDDLLHELRIKPIPLSDYKKTLEPLGFKVQ